MERKIASAVEIQQELDARINAKQSVLTDHARIKVQIPERKEPDANGCNWRVDFVGDIAGHEDVISQVVSQVQGMYNLKE